MITKSIPTMKLKGIEIKRSKSFILKIKDLEIKPTDVVCLVGANGSGKTTFLEAVVGLIDPDEGKISIKGQNLVLDNIEAKKKIGYVPDDDNWIIAELKSQEYFDLHISIYYNHSSQDKVRQNVKTLANELMFSSFDQPMGTLSHGNKKKVQIIAALLHDPAFLVVDELRNGLDPIAIKSVEGLLREKCKKGLAILAATHDLWWAERFSKFVVMINDGKVLLQQTTSNILKVSGSLENKFMELYDEHVRTVN